MISTIAGGGLGAIASPEEAPMESPSMAAHDPLRRGFYVMDEANGMSFLKFINTSNAPGYAGGHDNTVFTTTRTVFVTNPDGTVALKPSAFSINP